MKEHLGIKGYTVKDLYRREQAVGVVFLCPKADLYLLGVAAVFVASVLFRPRVIDEFRCCSLLILLIPPSTSNLMLHNLPL